MSIAKESFAQSVLCPPEEEVLEACGMLPPDYVPNGVRGVDEARKIVPQTLSAAELQRKFGF